MSPKLEWNDLVGGAKSPVPGAAIAGAPEAEAAAESPGTMMERANTFLDNALEMIRKIDEFAGIYLQLKAMNTQTEGVNGMTMKPGEESPGSSPGASPGAPTPSVDQIIALLDTIIEKEGDIPLSKFAQGLRGQEAWLIKYASEAAKQ